MIRISVIQNHQELDSVKSFVKHYKANDSAKISSVIDQFNFSRDQEKMQILQFLDDQSSLVGFCFFTIILDNVALIKLFLAPNLEQNAKECVESVNQYIFSKSNIKSIWHICSITERETTEILEALNSQHVGIFRHELYNFVKLDLEPMLVYELTKSDFENNKTSYVQSAVHSYGINNKNFLNKELLRLQTQGAFQSEVDSILADYLSGFNNKRILDIGSGAGNITYNLARKNPNHIFCGVDITPDFVEYANANFSMSNLSFKCLDVFISDEIIVDNQFFLLRFVSQHIGISGTISLLKKIKEIKKNRSESFTLIISDIDDRSWIFEPPCRAYDLAFKASQYWQKKHGGDRMIGTKIPEICSQVGLSIKKFEISKIDSIAIGIDSFEKIIDPMISDKVDISFLGNNEIYNLIKSDIQDYRKKERFGCGSLFTYVIEG